MKEYKGDITIQTAEEWDKFVKTYDSITGSIDMRGCTGLTSVTFPEKVDGYIDMWGCTGLTSVTFPEKVGGSIDMRNCTGLTSVTFPEKVGGSIDLDDHCSEYLLSLNDPRMQYSLDDVMLDRRLFDDIRHGHLSAQQVFAIPNMEQRRVAYARMDKARIAELPGLEVIDEGEDQYDRHHRVISFKVDGFDEPFLYYHCVCPSTGREYYLETRQKTCLAAKAASFGMTKDFEFTEEW